MTNLEQLKDLKNTYEKIKLLGKQERIQFLDGIVEYCKYIKFSKDKTLTMLALIRNFLPEPGQKFTECSLPDEVDVEFTKKIQDSIEFA